MAMSQTSVMKLYNTVVEDVIIGIRDDFLDDGVDEQVLQELRTLWKNKLNASGAMDPPQPDRAEPPPILQNFQKTNGAAVKRVLPMNEHQQGSSRLMGDSHGHQPGHMNMPGQASQALGSDRVPVQLTLPAQPGIQGSQPRVFTIQIPASALQGQQLHQILTGPVISATLNLPQHLAATILQQHINAALSGHDGGGGSNRGSIPFSGLDGANDSSDEEGSAAGGDGSVAGSEAGGGDDDDDDDDDEVEEEEEDEDRDAGGVDEEPLNSEDDVSDEEPGDMFDTENVVVCQYDKITRSRNRWKFYLKDGIMNLNGKDFVFQKANGDAEW